MNKIKIFKRIFLILPFVVLASCSDDDESNLFEGPHFAAFLGNSPDIVISEGGTATSLDLGITAVQSQDVTITLQITDGTAEQGTDYSISSTSMTIPAGEYNSNVTITPVDNDVFNEAKTFTIEIVDVSVAGLSIGNADEYSYIRTIVISNDDCPSQSNLWWGSLSVEDVGFGFLPGTGGANAAGDCDVLVVTSDLPNAGIGARPFALYFTPTFPGATSGTVDVPSQTYCTNCSAGLDAFYSATGTYDEDSQTIILFYSLDRTDGANFYTGTNIILPE